jgi:glycerol-3-phosphate dehydrogenase
LIDRLGRNETITMRPDIIINATGAWGDATLADWRIGSPRLFSGTKGSHFVTANRELRTALGDGGIYAEASDGRMVFVLPFGAEQTLVGTTDEPFDARPETAVAEPREIDYLIDLVNQVVPSSRLTRDDVVMSYSGVRPLPFVQADSPSSIPRGHWIDENTRGPIPILTLIGGKLTTCRALAEEVANRVLTRLRLPRLASSRERPIPSPHWACPSGSPVSALPTSLAGSSAETREPPRQAGWGSAETREPPRQAGWGSAETREPPRQAGWGCSQIVENLRLIIRHEWVRTLSDLVERRLLLIFDPQLDQLRLRELATLMADEGVIGADQVDSEVAATVARLRQHYKIDMNGSPRPTC